MPHTFLWNAEAPRKSSLTSEKSTFTPEKYLQILDSTPPLNGFLFVDDFVRMTTLETPRLVPATSTTPNFVRKTFVYNADKPMSITHETEEVLVNPRVAAYLGVERQAKKLALPDHNYFTVVPAEDLNT
jgi:hypothetical protein